MRTFRANFYWQGKPIADTFAATTVFDAKKNLNFRYPNARMVNIVELQPSPTSLAPGSHRSKLGRI
jgi:hypothetical protein